jgi:two-component system chemotaxis response regulator CheB
VAASSERALSQNLMNAPEAGGPTLLYSLVVVAASAGGLTALAALLADLPLEFPLPIAVVQHLDPRHQSVLPQILDRRTALRVKEAADGDRLTAGVVYTAPADRHVMIGQGRSIELNSSERVHFLRPAADHLFASAARVCGPVIAVVLTGTGTDGAAGIISVKAAGGTVIAQDEESSEFFGMPQAAIATGRVDFVLPLDRIGAALVALAVTRS